jgi:hypothetical protein
MLARDAFRAKLCTSALIRMNERSLRFMHHLDKQA